jgi:hypothetical protein
VTLKQQSGSIQKIVSQRGKKSEFKKENKTEGVGLEETQKAAEHFELK